MGNCLQRPKSDKQEIRDKLLRDDVDMITFYDTETTVSSAHDSIMDLDGTYKLNEINNLSLV